MQMLNKWGTINQKNYNKKCQQTKKYGHQRLLLGLYLSKILSNLGIVWWLDGGSLLGAHRDGKMIAHDDNFNFGILNSFQQFELLFLKIQETLNPKFKTRFINTYATKIQIYDPHSGAYYLDKLMNYRIHHVTVSLQLYTHQPNHRIKMMHQRRNLQDYVILFEDYILPLSTIQYCGQKFNAPQKLKTYLEAHYSYIGIGAIYNPQTRKYEDKKSISKMASNKADQGNHEDLKNQ